jgi:hypothetical protein
MANEEQVKRLLASVEGWNKWREENPDIKIELNEAVLSLTDLSFTNLSFANINLADLHGTKLRLADLREANLRGANLRGANLRGADLRRADLTGTDLTGADLRRADLTGADLRRANLILTNLTYTNFKEAKLDGARFMGASIYGTDFEDTDLSNVIGFDKADKEKPDERIEAGPPTDHVSLIEGNLSRRELRQKLRQYWEYRPILQEDNAPVGVDLRHTSRIFHRKRLDSVHFAVTSLPAVIAGDHFHLDFWMYLENKLEDVIRRAKEELNAEKIHLSTEGPVELERGTHVTVEVNINKMAIDPPRKDVLWIGKISKAGFIVTVPKEAEEDIYDGKATVSCNGLQIAQVRFLIQVGDTVSSVDLLPIEVKAIRKAFASYASEDRAKVLGRIQGMQKILPNLEVFIDVISLRSGQKWEQELWKVIPTYDVFYLFWSVNAKSSHWVDKEWRCALKTRDLDYIDPVPLVSPKEAPPPPELASKHFNDWMLPYMRVEKEAD